MTENVESLILEHLRAIRGDIAKLSEKIDVLTYRTGSIEERLTLVERGVANLHADIAAIQQRLDRQNDRLERIERRLDLAPV